MVAGVPNSRGALVSFSQNSNSGSCPSGCGPAVRAQRPMVGSSAQASARVDSCAVAAQIDGFGEPSCQDQRLRNHTVGRTCSAAGSGPALRIRSRTQTSNGEALAYSAVTTQ